ncbi:MAG: hypothetical protein KME13_16595 [Myxacorys californica WJT36-NPBG1]|nr:hypothetical protein [Myxacorys californica WJT36-NPBG1]
MQFALKAQLLKETPYKFLEESRVVFQGKIGRQRYRMHDRTYTKVTG